MEAKEIQKQACRWKQMFDCKSLILLSCMWNVTAANTGAKKPEIVYQYFLDMREVYGRNVDTW